MSLPHRALCGLAVQLQHLLPPGLSHAHDGAGAAEAGRHNRVQLGGAG